METMTSDVQASKRMCNSVRPATTTPLLLKPQYSFNFTFLHLRKCYSYNNQPEFTTTTHWFSSSPFLCTTANEECHREDRSRSYKNFIVQLHIKVPNPYNSISKNVGPPIPTNRPYNQILKIGS